MFLNVKQFLVDDIKTKHDVLPYTDFQFDAFLLEDQSEGTFENRPYQYWNHIMQ